MGLPVDVKLAVISADSQQIARSTARCVMAGHLLTDRQGSTKVQINLPVLPIVASLFTSGPKSICLEMRI
jgi:hypothetical protein